MANAAANTAATVLTVRLASSVQQRAWFDAQLYAHHEPGSTPTVGDFLRQVVELDGRPVALLAWGPACYALKDRDRWISWCVLRGAEASGPPGLQPGAQPLAPGPRQPPPQALALDGKMLRDHFGILSLSHHENGAPEAMAQYDQKEGTTRCEQSVAQELVDSLPALDGKLLTADALHCQRALARTIVEKGGEYLLQIKGNQSNLEALARAKERTPGTPFYPDGKRPWPGGAEIPSLLCDRRHGPADRRPRGDPRVPAPEVGPRRL